MTADLARLDVMGVVRCRTPVDEAATAAPDASQAKKWIDDWRAQQ